MNILGINKNNTVINQAEQKENSSTETCSNKIPTFTQILEELHTSEVSSKAGTGSINSPAMGTGYSSNNANFTVANTIPSMRLSGDYISSFKIEEPTKADTEHIANGMATSFGKSGEKVIKQKTIDKTSKIYEQALELESYFVKIMLSSMRKTLTEKTLAGDQSFAGKMYNDMRYEELERTITKNAGFGLADQIYLELTNNKI